MAIGKLQEILKQLDAINPEELGRSMKGDSSPELVECLQSVRQKLEKHLDIIIKAIEGDYRTAPLVHQPQPEIEAKNESAKKPAGAEYVQARVKEYLRQTAKKDASSEKKLKEKIDFLDGCQSPAFNRIIRPHAKGLSLPTMKLFTETARSIDVAAEHIKDPKGLDDSVGKELQKIIEFTEKIIELLITRQQQNASVLTDSAQSDWYKPYLDCLHSQGVHYSQQWEETKLFEKSLFTIQFIHDLWHSLESQTFSLELTDIGYFFNEAPVPLPIFLAGYSRDLDLDEYLQYNPKQIPESIKQWIAWLKILAAKCPEMGGWLKGTYSVKKKRKEINHFFALHDRDWEEFSATDAQNFIEFAENSESLKRYKKLSRQQRTSFLLGRDYTLEALLKLMLEAKLAV